MNRTATALGITCVIVCCVFAMTHANQGSRPVALPTGRILAVPVPGFIARTNSYPATIALSPDGRFAAFLNQGYGTEESGVRQSIAVLDLSNNEVRDFPDDRLRGDEKSTLQSYFLGLAFSRDGKHLYASLGSMTQNGIAIYRFAEGQVSPERYLPIPPQTLRLGKIVTYDTGANPKGTAVPYPAGLAVLDSAGGDRLLV